MIWTSAPIYFGAPAPIALDVSTGVIELPIQSAAAGVDAADAPLDRSLPFLSRFLARAVRRGS